MNKRKKASPSASRSTRTGHMLGPPRTTGAARATKSNGTKGSDLGSRKAAFPKPVPGEPTRDGPAAPVSLTTLTLAAECMVSDAAALKERLAALIDEPLAVTLDITALQRI